MTFHRRLSGNCPEARGAFPVRIFPTIIPTLADAFSRPRKLNELQEYPQSKGIISRNLKLSATANPVMERAAALRHKGIWIDCIGPVRFLGPRLYAFDLLSKGTVHDTIECEVLDVQHLLSLEKEIQTQLSGGLEGPQSPRSRSEEKC
jgi:hypothetical protein